MSWNLNTWVSGTDEAECSRKVVSGRREVGTVKSLVNATSLKLQCARVLNQSLLVPVLTYSRETMIWREKERSKIKAVQKDNLRGLLCIRRMDSDGCMDMAIVRSDEGCGRKD